MDCRVAPIDLDVNQAVSLGLIVNELITNALKCAFPEGRHGHIRVTAHQQPDGQLELTVSDDGVGKVAAPTLKSSTSFGTDLIAMLARKLRATLEHPPGSGYTTRLQFATG